MNMGKIHSFESCGTVDGPGIRFVVFMQGCPLRCQYCHNPDTWDTQKGNLMTAADLMTEITKYRSYMNFSGGGVTITGGEPMLQPDFVLEVFKSCKAEGIHTALDTSGFILNDSVKEVLSYTDLILLDIKSINPDTFKRVTSFSLDPVLSFAQYAASQQIDMWVRFVLVPGLTDNLEDVAELGKYIQTLSSVKKIEVLPFHKMGEYKWETLGFDYQLKDTPSPDKALVEEVKSILKSFNPNIEVR